MGLFEQFPYTNFHELNLDTLAKIVSDVKLNIDGILDEAKAYTDSKLAYVDAELQAQIATVNAMLDQAQQNFDDLAEALTETVQQYYDDGKSYTDEQVAALKTYVDSELANVGVDVLNPVTGTYTTIQAAIYSLYGLHTEDTLTATEYDTLVSNAPMTATAYDAKQLTAQQYDLSGRTLLP